MKSDIIIETPSVSEDFLSTLKGQKFSTILADPPWQFDNRTGKMAPEHKRLSRYSTLSLKEIMEIPVAEVADKPSHLYLWVPNALLPQGLEVLAVWGNQSEEYQPDWETYSYNSGSSGQKRLFT